MSKVFIINEWLFSDLNGDNGEEKQRESFSFLVTLYNRCDRIAVAQGSRFQEKEWKFSKNTDEFRRTIARFYFGCIRYNPQKYQEVVSWEEENDLDNIKSDDIYLVQTYYKTKALIVTTDNELINILQTKNIPCELRDIFLKEYFYEE